jgi:hypothetical protein
MKTFFKRLGRTIADLVTSKKAIATAIGMVATAAGQPAIGAVAAAYVLGQGVADHGKEAAKKLPGGVHTTGKLDKSGHAVP